MQAIVGLKLIELPHNSISSSFDYSEVESINLLMSALHPEKCCEICSTFCKYHTLQLRGKVYGCYQSRSKNSRIILAELCGET